MFPRYGDTRGMDYMRLNPMRTKPARQPEAVPTSFEGQCNPRDLAAGLDRLVAPAMQQGKQPFWVRLQLLAGLALNAGKHTGNQPTRLAHLDDGNDRAILVQGDEGPAQVVRLGHRGTPCWIQRRWCHFLAARPIASLGPARSPASNGAFYITGSSSTSTPALSAAQLPLAAAMGRLSGEWHNGDGGYQRRSAHARSVSGGRRGWGARRAPRLPPQL